MKTIDPMCGVPTVVAFGETLVDQFGDRAVLGGAPFNVSCHLAALGAHPVLVTRAGKDDAGDLLQQAMAARGLDLRGLQTDPARPTGRVMVTEDANGHRFDILPDQAYDHIHANLARMVGLSAHPALVYFGTLSQRSDESRRALRELLGAVEACAFLDLNLRDPWVDADTVRWSLARASVAKLNEDELVRVGRLLGLGGETPAAPAALAAVLRSAFELQQVIVTAGPSGAWALDPAGRLEAVTGTPLRQLVDTVGAGDGFAAVVMLGMLRGWPTADTLVRADAFARALCGIRGAVPASQAFYTPFRGDWRIETEATHA